METVLHGTKLNILKEESTGINFSFILQPTFSSHICSTFLRIGEISPLDRLTLVKMCAANHQSQLHSLSQLLTDQSAGNLKILSIYVLHNKHSDHHRFFSEKRWLEIWGRCLLMISSSVSLFLSPNLNLARVALIETSSTIAVQLHFH